MFYDLEKYASVCVWYVWVCMKKCGSVCESAFLGVRYSMNL